MMRGKKAKALRRMARMSATDDRGLQWSNGTCYHPEYSPRALYQFLKKMYTLGRMVRMSHA